MDKWGWRAIEELGERIKLFPLGWIINQILHEASVRFAEILHFVRMTLEEQLRIDCPVGHFDKLSASAASDARSGPSTSSVQALRAGMTDLVYSLARGMCWLERKIPRSLCPRNDSESAALLRTKCPRPTSSGLQLFEPNDRIRVLISC